MFLTVNTRWEHSVLITGWANYDILIIFSNRKSKECATPWIR